MTGRWAGTNHVIECRRSQPCGDASGENWLQLLPINADYYRYLTFRMYSSNTTCNSGGIQWFTDDSYTNASMGLSNGFLVPPNPCFQQPAGWYTYVIDLKTIGLYQGGASWSGLIRE